MGCSGMYAGSYGYATWIIFKVVLFIVASFVFSAILWTTKHWLEKGNTKKKKK